MVRPLSRGQHSAHRVMGRPRVGTLEANRPGAVTSASVWPVRLVVADVQARVQWLHSPGHRLPAPPHPHLGQLPRHLPLQTHRGQAGEEQDRPVPQRAGRGGEQQHSPPATTTTTTQAAAAAGGAGAGGDLEPVRAGHLAPGQLPHHGGLPQDEEGYQSGGLTGAQVLSHSANINHP